MQPRVLPSPPGFGYFIAILLVSLVAETLALASRAATPSSRSRLVFDLQKNCRTPQDVLQRVGKHVTPDSDKDASLASLVLVRLSKQLISIDNSNSCNEIPQITGLEPSLERIIRSVVRCLVNQKSRMSQASIDSIVDGTKACSVLARLDPYISAETFLPLWQYWNQYGVPTDTPLQSHHMSGLKWAFDNLQYSFSSSDENQFTCPAPLQQSWEDLKLPFSIFPGAMSKHVPGLSVKELTSQVSFQVDDVKTASKRIVPERRQTAWQGDDSVAPFEYSGKSMPRQKWSPLVETVRNRLHTDYRLFYDGCLLNLYPDGGSGMRYHIDPDQGTLWDYDSAVVSVGATRRFAFRSIRQHDPSNQPHNFVVFHGDVVHMYGSCQQDYQHTVKKADDPNETAARASLVFKRTWGE